jgi:hypothetical protein
MSAYKQFTTKDIVITPFSANKGFRYRGPAMTASNVGIEIYYGTQPPANKLIFETTAEGNWGVNAGFATVSGSQNASGFVNKLNTNSVYSSVMQLYYSNYFESMSGSQAATSSLLYGLSGPQNNTFANYNNIDLGINGSNNMPIGAVKSPQYDNYLSSTIPQIRTALLGESTNVGWVFPSNMNYLSAISIPSKLYGQNIEPESFRLSLDTVGSFTVWDDGDGNLFYNIPGSRAGQYCGNIIYEHGLAILTPISQSNPETAPGNGGIPQIGAFILQNQPGYNTGTDYLDNTTVGFSSSITLYEHQYKCVVRENEFGYSLNPSLLSGSQASAPLPGTNYVYKDFATGSYFSPYITTVGLYDNDQNLLAVGKLSVPTKVPMNSDLEIQVAFDSI